MSASFDIRIDKRQTDQLFRAMQLASNRLNKSTAETLKWGAALVCKSIGARTKQSPKLRPIVKNPNKRAFVDGRMAKFGVYKYRNGAKVFDPIYRGGEFGMIYYQTRKSATILSRDPATGKLVKTTHEAGTGEFQVPGVEQSKKRIIGRRGLAKRMWSVALGKIGKGRLSGDATAQAEQIARREMDVTQNLTGADLSIRLNNQLRYATAALKGGESAIASAMAAAGSGMLHQVRSKIYGKAFAK
jgi:hypothetical protein